MTPSFFTLLKYFISIICLCISVCATAVDITGAGSSAAKPLYTKWADSYSRSSTTILRYDPIGSSGGIKKIKEGAVDFGASDVALSEDDARQAKLVCFPSAISGVVPVIHLPGIKSGDLQLTGEVLAKIFSSKIVKWNDPAISTINPGLNLPKLKIIVVARQDGSGTTYNFTDYLSKISPSWKQDFGTNFTIKWAADTILAKGSSGIVAAVKQTTGAISYVDYNYVIQDQLTYVSLKNRDGKFVSPGPDGFSSALNNSSWKTKATFEEMLTDKPGLQSWPITMGTFIIASQSAKNPETAVATLEFFAWAFMYGNQIVNGMDFVHLPDRVQARIYSSLTKITDINGQPLRWSIPVVR